MYRDVVWSFYHIKPSEYIVIYFGGRLWNENFCSIMYVYGNLRDVLSVTERAFILDLEG